MLQVPGGNVAVGDNAGGGATNTADNNVWIGNNAGYATTSGTSNVFVGYASGDATLRQEALILLLVIILGLQIQLLQVIRPLVSMHCW